MLNKMNLEPFAKLGIEFGKPNIFFQLLGYFRNIGKKRGEYIFKDGLNLWISARKLNAMRTLDNNINLFRRFRIEIINPSFDFVSGIKNNEGNNEIINLIGHKEKAISEMIHEAVI